MTTKQLKLLEEILDIAPDEKLNIVLNKALTLALLIDNTQLSGWLQNELCGYTENPMTPPVYRKVDGWFADSNGNRLEEYYSNSPNFKFNYFYLRQGIPQLEHWVSENQRISLHSSNAIDTIAAELDVPITQFILEPSLIKPVFQSIRNHLIKELIIIRKAINSNLTFFSNTEMQKLISNLHPTLQTVAAKLIENEHYRSAILDTFIKLVEEVKKKSNVFDKDNSPLVDFVFSPKNPILKISDDDNEQQGLMFLFKGAIMYFRNANAHQVKNIDDSVKAFQILGFASLLFQILDDTYLAKS